MLPVFPPLDDFESRVERRFYIHLAGIEQVRVGRSAEGSNRPLRVPFVPPPDIFEDDVEARIVRDPNLRSPPPGPDLGRGDEEDLHVGARTNDRADVTTVENRSRSAAGEPALKIQKLIPEFRQGCDT